jgi:hypothetical protein
MLISVAALCLSQLLALWPLMSVVCPDDLYHRHVVKIKIYETPRY